MKRGLVKKKHDLRIELAVRNIVVIASGKGGVGKTLASVNLAVELGKRGYRVGLLDGDMTGPSVPIMTGTAGVKAEVRDRTFKMVPVEACGIKCISTGHFIVGSEQIAWRGPMIHSTMIQFLRDVDWGELDYLVIDSSPGTSDSHLTFIQAVDVTGVIFVTTPQYVALDVVKRAVKMFKDCYVPMLGVVENMTAFICSHGSAYNIFGSGGGQLIADQFGIPLLGQIPLDQRVQGEVGMPLVLSAPDSVPGQAFRKVVDAVVAEIGISDQLRAGHART